MNKSPRNANMKYEGIEKMENDDENLENQGSG